MIGLFDPATEIALIIGVMSGATMLLVVAAFAGGGSRRYSRRLQSVTTRKPGMRSAVDAPTRSLARQTTTTPGLDAFFRLLPRREALIERLSRTGREISVGQYMLGTIAAIIVATGVLYWFFGGLGLLPCLMFGIGIGTFIPHYAIGWLGRKRIARFIGLFPEAIDLMVRALRAGLPISEAIINAGQEIGDPVGQEFRGIEAGMRLGRDLDSLLWDIATRIPAPEFRSFIIALT